MWARSHSWPSALADSRTYAAAAAAEGSGWSLNIGAGPWPTRMRARMGPTPRVMWATNMWGRIGPTSLLLLWARLLVLLLSWRRAAAAAGLLLLGRVLMWHLLLARDCRDLLHWDPISPRGHKPCWERDLARVAWDHGKPWHTWPKALEVSPWVPHLDWHGLHLW